MGTEEVWKDIQGLEGLYQISNKGRARSLPRSRDTSYTTITGKTVTRITLTKGKILKPSLIRSGYLRIKVEDNDKKPVQVYIHKAVAHTFCEGYGEGLVVDHIDDDKLNNYFENLQWVTKNYNVAKSHPKHLGKKAAAYTGEVLAYDKDTGELLHTLRGNHDMKEKGFDFRNVSAVLMGKRNYHNGCIFVKVLDKREKEVITTCFTKSNFSKLNVVDADNNVVDYINDYEELIEKGFIFQKVQRVLMGLEVSHRGYTFTIKEEK